MSGSRRFLIVGAVVAIAWAQSPRDSYRTAYAQWHQADPNLERDAATGQGAAVAGFAQRAEKVARAATAYGTARASFLRNASHQDIGSLATPFQPELELLPSRDLQSFVQAETKTVDANIKRFENDRDPGIVQWRQALERERVALAALGNAIEERKAATAKATAATGVIEASVKAANVQFAQCNTAIGQAANILDQETSAWAEYYTQLAKAATAPAPPPTPVGVPQPQVTTGVPLIRYTGTWSFPDTNGIFSGVKPEFVDLAVHEENGQLKGAFYGRFTIPAGAKTDPVLRFDFSGPLSSARVQTLSLETSDGVKGSIDLIPGSAFNLLEINFHLEPKPGKLQQGDMVLLKK